MDDMPDSKEFFCQTRQPFADIHILHGPSVGPCRIHNAVWRKKVCCLGMLSIFKHALKREVTLYRLVTAR